MNSKIPQDWKIWAEENIHNGSDPEELIDDTPRRQGYEIIPKNTN